jgi:hypothetical protein
MLVNLNIDSLSRRATKISDEGLRANACIGGFLVAFVSMANGRDLQYMTCPLKHASLYTHDSFVPFEAGHD